MKNGNNIFIYIYMSLKKHALTLLFYILISTIYAIIYYIYRRDINGLSRKSTFLDCWYFSFTTFSTVGYGDLSPQSTFMKLVVISQQMFLLLDLADDTIGLFFPKLLK